MFSPAADAAPSSAARFAASELSTVMEPPPGQAQVALPSGADIDTGM
jgi:hypothetical protein